MRTPELLNSRERRIRGITFFDPDEPLMHSRKIPNVQEVFIGGIVDGLEMELPWTDADYADPTRQKWLLRNYVTGNNRIQRKLAGKAKRLWGVDNPMQALYLFLFPDYDFTPVHRAMTEFLWAHINDSSFQLAPRAWGKSDIRTVTSVVYDCLREPNIRLGIVSKTFQKAKDLLGGARKHLESFKVMDVFGIQSGAERWGAEAFTLGGRTKPYGEASVTAVGMDTQIASAHYNKLYPDDIVDENNSQTPTMREKLQRRFWKELHPTLIPGGSIHASGTRQHPDDLYANWLAEDGLFCNAFARIPALNSRGESNWPEKYPLHDTKVGTETREGLLTKRRNLGPPIFEAQYQNEVKLLEGHVIKPKWIKEFYYEQRAQDIEDFFKGKRLFLAADLAIGKEISSDEFVVIMIGVDVTDGHIYVGPYYNDHLTFHQQTEKIVAFWERWKDVSTIVRTGIEKNAYQAAQVESVNIRAKVGAVGIHTSKDKRTRLEAVSGLFEAGQVHLWKGHADELIEQLLAFPSTSVKDDIVDALIMAIELARKYSSAPFSMRIHG